MVDNLLTIIRSKEYHTSTLGEGLIFRTTCPTIGPKGIPFCVPKVEAPLVEFSQMNESYVAKVSKQILYEHFEK